MRASPPICHIRTNAAPAIGVDAARMPCTNDAMTTPDLSGAYALDGADACRRLYADWADSYDSDFAAGMDYRLPAETAAAWLRSDPPPGPVLDVGAGTGLLAAALRGMGHRGAIDAVDLSEAMLDRAARKGLYRRLTAADVTRPLPLPAEYAGIVSSGTFTHGHVGPDALDELLRVAVPGAFFALSVHSAVFETAGFDRKLRNLAPMVRDLSIEPVAIYGHGAGGDHATDQALIVSFRRA